MFCSKTANNLINKIHKRSLRVIYEMEKANFENLLRIALGLFMKTIFSEIHKPLNHISPLIMQEFFDLKVTPYSLRNNNLLRLPKTNT